jgi:type IV secretion system protein VirB6
MVCPALPPGAGFISSMASYVDCQSQILGSGGWAALAMPGSTLSILLTGFLTIVIALIGYDLLLGHALTVRSGTLTAVKIGAVLALATSWPAYRTLVYDLVVDGPGQLVAEIGPQAGIVGSDGSLLQRLDLTDHGLAQLAILGPGNATAEQYAQIPPSPFGGFDAFALGGARILFLLTAIAGLAAVRIVTGIMLALGPFFIAFLMFESTRSLFEGWVRVLGGAALSAIGVTSVLGLELALIEPWLSTVLARRMAGEALPTVSVELLVVAMLFAIIVVVALIACARVARGFRLPFAVQLRPAVSNVATLALERSAALSDRSPVVESERSRAAAVASALVSMNRGPLNPSRVADVEVISSTNRPSVANRPAGADGRAPAPVGRTFSRRSASRVSARANRRDASA